MNEPWHHGAGDVNAALMNLIERLQDSVHSMDDKLDKRELLLVETINKAFPNDDHEAHRRYHEQIILVMEERTAFWKKMKEELMKWGLIGFMGWGLGALWLAFLSGPHK